MTTPPTGTPARPPGAPAYELCVEGHLDDHWAAMLDDLTLVRCPDGTTTLTGPVADQAQLHGILARVRDLGLSLVLVRRCDAHVPADTARPTPPGPTRGSTRPAGG